MRSLIITIFIFALIAQQQVQATSRIDTTQAQDAWGTFKQSWPTKYWNQFYTCRDQCQADYQCGSGTQCETDMIANQAAQILDTEENCPSYSELLTISDADFKQDHENFRDWANCLWQLGSTDDQRVSPLGNSYYLCVHDCVFVQKELFEEENQEQIKKWWKEDCDGDDCDDDYDELNEEDIDYEAIMQCEDICYEDHECDDDCVSKMFEDWEWENETGCRKILENFDIDMNQSNTKIAEELKKVYQETKFSDKMVEDMFECVRENRFLLDEVSEGLWDCLEVCWEKVESFDNDEFDEDDVSEEDKDAQKECEGSENQCYYQVIECLSECGEQNCPDLNCLGGDGKKTFQDDYAKNENCKSFQDQQEAIEENDDFYSAVPKLLTKELANCAKDLIQNYLDNEEAVEYLDCIIGCADGAYASSMTFALVSFLVALFIAC